MRKLLHCGIAGVFSLFWATLAWAQSANDLVWVQIEAHPSFTVAEQRAQLYALQVEDVNGFALPGGWFGIALGPYRAADAQQVLQVYRIEGIIPSDSYIAFSTAYAQQFFPPGVDILSRGVIALEPQIAETETTTEPEAPEVAAATPEPQPVIDETPAEARRSERALSADDRKALQIALQWAGFYNSTIDGAFGRGTRGAMADWQAANGYDPTGTLTTLQRAALIGQYNAVLEGMDLQIVRDDKAGIEMLMPLGVVGFESYDYPFAKYSATGEIPAQVLLISQAGDQSTLFGLYDIMQTLEIVPLDGRRERRENSFLLIGQNDRIVSHTEVDVRGGEVKGFTLIWPAGDEERRRRVLDEMRASYQRTQGVIDPSWSESDTQAIDLVSGLQIRKPRLSRSGFFVNAKGAVVTTLEAVRSCTRITIDGETDAQLSLADNALGIAVLEPAEALAPRAIAEFSPQAPRLQSEVAVAGYSYEGALGSPTMTFGAVSELRGLRGEEELSRLSIDALEGDAGGPVFDEAGGVMGMLLPRISEARRLPDEVSFAAKSDVVLAMLDQSGIASLRRESQAPMAPEDITERARDMTVLVSCWD